MTSDHGVAARGGRDWRAWHEAYRDPASSLTRRLATVRRRVGEALDAGPAAPRVLSLCAGEGGDVLPEVAARPSLQAEVVLVELDPELAARARASAARLGVTADVRVADAGRHETIADVVPVDLLLLCGIFGNVSDDDVRRTVAATPALLRPGGTVVWTRGRFGDDDLRPAIRRWFAAAGLVEVAFDEEPESFGVGVGRRPGDVDAPPVPPQLFTFAT